MRGRKRRPSNGNEFDRDEPPLPVREPTSAGRSRSPRCPNSLLQDGRDDWYMSAPFLAWLDGALASRNSTPFNLPLPNGRRLGATKDTDAMNTRMMTRLAKNACGVTLALWLPACMVGTEPFDDEHLTDVESTSQPLTFSNCSPGEIDRITNNRSAVQRMMPLVMNELREDSKVFEQWFGGAWSYDVAHPASGRPIITVSSLGIASSIFGHIASHADVWHIECNGGLCDEPKYSTTLAYVRPDVHPDWIYICAWNAGFTLEKQVQTLIHEASHQFGTDDVSKSYCSGVSANVCYGSSNARSLALNDPASTVSNASSYEYFATAAFKTQLAVMAANL